MRYLFCISFLLLSWTSFAQKVQFVAESNATDVVLGNAFRVSFRLENSEIQKISFPEFEKLGFRIMSGPMHARQYQNVNGRSSTSETYSFVLAPSKTGKLRIGAAQIRASDGLILESKPISINCVKSSKEAKNTDRHGLPSSIAGKILFQVEASRKKAVVGEQITLNFNIYTKIDISSIQLTDEPGFDNEYSFPIRYYDKNSRIAVLNGQQYATKTIHSIGVFPSKEGILKVDPAKLRIALGAVDPFNPFSKGASYELRSEALEIEVESLMGKNSDFTGAVGQYQMQLYLEEDEISTDDILKLSMRIQGKGDLKQLLPPKIKMDGRGPFHVYEPKIEEDLKEGRQGLAGTKTFTYTLEPQAVGELKIIPTFTYYDTKKRKFVTQDSILKIKVRQGGRKVGNLAVEEADQQDSIQLAAAMLEFKAALSSANWKKAQQPLFGSLSFWLVTLSPFAIFWILFGLRKFRDRHTKRREEALERTKADRLAKEQLARAKEFLIAKDNSNFFQTIESTLKEYLGEKLRLSGAEVSTERILSQLEKLDLEVKIRTELEEILKVCEKSVYAAQNNEQTMQNTYDRSKKLIKMFNKSLNQHA